MALILAMLELRGKEVLEELLGGIMCHTGEMVLSGMVLTPARYHISIVNSTEAISYKGEKFYLRGVSLLSRWTYSKKLS